MDTKSKSNHKLGIVLSVLVVIGAAVIMVGLYPFFKSESSRYQKPVYEDLGFLHSLVTSNYVLNVMQLEKGAGGAAISPFMVYFPEVAYQQEAQSADGADGRPDSPEVGEQTDAGGDSADGGASDMAGTENTLVSFDQGRLEADLGVDIGDVGDAGQPLEDAEGTGLAAESPDGPGDQQEEGISMYQQYVQSLKIACNREYGIWMGEFNSVRKYLDYQVLTPEGQILLDHAGGKDLRNSDGYAFKVVMNYDESGAMAISPIEGENTRQVINILESYATTDPMRNFYWEQFLYEPEFTFEYPRNVTFVYGMSQEGMQQYGANQTDSWSAYYESGTVARVFTGLLAAVSLLTLLLSCFTATRAEGIRLLRAPFELTLAAALCAVTFGYSLVGLVAMTNQGQLYDALLRANFLPKAAAWMVRLWNVMWWCVPFALTCWAVLCFKDIFIKEFRDYIRERTLVGISWTWLKEKWKRFYDAMLGVDLRDPSDRPLWKIVAINFLVLSVICSLWFFGIGALIIYSLLLFIVLKKYYTDLRKRYRSLLHATGQIAEGNLDVVITENLGVFEPFKEEIQKIQQGFKVAVEEEVKSQNMKTDLITNVSHDLKTPLTAIITYVNLLKEESVTPEQRRTYIDVLEQKSMRLKALIEDLFEISKATSNNVTLNLVNVDIVSLLKEVCLELGDKIEESSIDFRWNLPEEKIILPLDSQKTYRIFDNLLTNVIKYAMPRTRAYVDMKKQEDSVLITIKNVSASELDHMNPIDLTDRFVRGDQSRNTEGSGLGLAIAKSFVELQRGKMDIEVEADLFRVKIWWPLPAAEEEEKTPDEKIV